MFLRAISAQETQVWCDARRTGDVVSLVRRRNIACSYSFAASLRSGVYVHAIYFTSEPGINYSDHASDDFCSVVTRPDAVGGDSANVAFVLLLCFTTTGWRANKLR